VAPLREIDPTGLYHVMSRGNFKQQMFLDEDHYAKYLRLVDRVSCRRRWDILDWCLMPNHSHLLVQLHADGLSDGMRELNGCFSRWSNFRTGRTGTGHLIKNRPLLVDVIREGHLWELLSYIPLNPVRGGLVDEPWEWPWSGHRAILGLERPYRFHQPWHLLRLFGGERAQALARYEAHIRDSRARDRHASWSDHVVWEAPSRARMVESLP
jgi:REP-associated tyrosine transposase